jgi:Flp pilus assembly protein TadD
MSPQLSRAILLAQQHRYEQAIGELMMHLGQNTQDAHAHALLAQCHLALDHYDEAQRHAQEAIALAPDNALGYEMLASVFAERNRLGEAVEAVDSALRLNPQDADIYGLKASILLRQHKWRAAADATEQGLMLDPEHNVCTNVRAQALVMLGDRAGAAQTVQDALRHNPDDPWIHANQGWACLHANDPKAAAVHFREALRLDPTMEFARAGIIEALKARNFLYRWMLQYFLMMARLPSQARWGIIIGLYLAQRFLSSFAAQNPAFAPYVWPILGVLIGFAVLSWLSYPLFNLMLRLDPFGRHVLAEEERKGANLLGATLLVALLAIIGYFVSGEFSLLLAALVFGLLSLPISSVYVLDAGWPRYTMMAATAALLLIGLPLMTPVFVWKAIGSPELVQSAYQLAGLFPYGILGSQILANMLMGVKVQK